MPDKNKLLLEKFAQLPDEQQNILLEFLGFLHQKHAIDEPIATSPLDIPRPEDESVVKAVKRLSKTYPMLDSKELFDKTSSFMMRNLMHGEDAKTLIDEMEIYFEESYQLFSQSKVG